MQSESLRGRLVVAAPTLLDPNFHRTVVLIGEHTDEGALGIVLNRASETPVSEAVPDLADLVAEEATVHVGGPVQPSAVLVLAQFAERAEAPALILDDVGFLSVDADGQPLSRNLQRARVFAGYAGWGPGQLEGEVEREDWIVAPARPQDAFADDPSVLWSAVLDRMGGRYRLLARLPLDPSLN